jgi:hypothetical protein
MFWLILLNFISFSLGQLSAVSRSDGLNIYFFDIFLIFSNLTLFLYIMKRGKFKINFPLLTFIFFFLYSLIFTFSQIYYFDFLSILQSLSYLLRFSAYFIFGYFIYLLLSSKLLSTDQLKNIFVINFIFLTTLNLLQLVFLNNLTYLAQYGWDPHIGRLTGSFLDPNFMAFYLCIYYVLNNYFIKNKYLEYISIFSIFLTLSRNGILTFLLLFLILNIKNFKKLIILFFCFLLFLIINPRILDRFIQFQNSDDSSYQRVISWNEALKLSNFNNFQGVGFNNYKNNLEFYRINSLDSLKRNSVNSTDSSFLHVYVTLGFLGLILVLVLLGGFMFKKGFIMLNTILLIGLFFNSQFINSLFYPQISVLLFCTLNLGIYLKESEF